MGGKETVARGVEGRSSWVRRSRGDGSVFKATASDVNPSNVGGLGARARDGRGGGRKAYSGYVAGCCKRPGKLSLPFGTLIIEE